MHNFNYWALLDDPIAIEVYNIYVSRIMIFSITAFTAHTGEEI